MAQTKKKNKRKMSKKSIDLKIQTLAAQNLLLTNQQMRYREKTGLSKAGDLFVNATSKMIHKSDSELQAFLKKSEG